MEKEHNLLESDVVTLTLDDDVEIECQPLSQLLIWILPNTLHFFRLMKTVEMRTEDVWIYRFIRDTTGGSDHDLQNIEDDDEYDALRISLMNGLIHRNLKALILKNNYFIL